MRSISNEELDVFCKNVYNIQVLISILSHFNGKSIDRSPDKRAYQAVSNRTLVDERNEPATETVMMASFEPYDDDQQTPILWYLGLRAADRFHTQVQ